MAQNSKFSAPACTAILGDGQEFRLVLSISSSFYTNQLFVVLFTLIKYLVFLLSVSISTVCTYVYVFLKYWTSKELVT